MWTQVSFTTGFVWFLVFSLENKCSHTGLPSFPKPSESTWSTEDDPSVGPLRHHLNELWHYSQFCMWRAFVLLCEMLACCGFVCWKNIFHLVCLKIPTVTVLKSLLSTLLPARTQTEVQTAATTCSSCNWIKVVTDTFHTELYIHTIPQFYFKACLETLLLFALDIIVLFSWTDWKATCT